MRRAFTLWDGTFTPPAEPPPPPLGEFRIADVTATDLLIDLPAVANAEVYRVERRTGGGAWESVGRSTVPFVIANGLTPSTAYDVRWQAETETGTVLSAWSNPISGSTDVVVAARRLPNWIQNWVTHVYPTVTGTTRNCSTQAELNAALAAAVDGDEIVLQAGVMFDRFTLPNRGTSGWVVIRSSALSNLPEKVRVSPGSATHMPRIRSTVSSARHITLANGARGWWLAGLHVEPTLAPSFGNMIIEVTPGRGSLADIAQDIVFDRCLIRGHETADTRRCIWFDCIRGMVRDCHVDRAKESGSDSQAILTITTPGPLLFVNNFLEGAGMSFMSGGVDTAITNLVPEDLCFVGNTFHKPLSWIGSTYTIKNSFELKNARRVLLARNVAENQWDAGQQYALTLTVRNQSGGNPWAQVADVIVRGNRWADVFSYANILPFHFENGSDITRRILMRDELIIMKDLVASNNERRVIQMEPFDSFTFEHCTVIENTVERVGSGVLFSQPGPSSNFTVRNNLYPSLSWAVFLNGGQIGTAALNTTYGSSWQYQANVLPALLGSIPSQYPSGNFFPATVAAIGFTNPASGDFSLLPTSAYRNAGTDGRDIGADFARVAL